MGSVEALRRRGLAGVLVALSVAGALALDLAIPSYPIAGFYLVPVTLAALTLRIRRALVVSGVCLGLALAVIQVQGRWDGPTVSVACFTVLSGAALIALSYLFKQVGELYETERIATGMLESLAAQLQTLQEVVVLDYDRPLSELLGGVVEQARQLLGCDDCRIYRFDEQRQVLVAAGAGGTAAHSPTLPLTEGGPVVRAHIERQPVALRGDGPEGALLAVPLLVRSEPYGVLALTYRGEREFTDLDVRLAASFGGQVALAIENGRLRDEVRQAAAASERSRLARDLHDSVTQSLFAASLKAEAVRRRWRPASEEARENLRDVERLARGALAEMRTLLMELRPDALAGASLPRLLELLVAAAEGGSRVRVELDVRGPSGLPEHVSVALFRIAQEALQNMSRHSGADRAWVMLDASGPDVRLTVRDDGRGFDVEAVPSDHLGLRMMRERAEDAGVRVTVESVPVAGTTVTAVWAKEDGKA